MKIIGNSQFAAAPDEVYRALNDPAVLVRSIPGCHRLEALGDDAYTMTVAAGVGSIKGVYDGEVRLTDHDEPASFRLHAQGAGAAGTITAVVAVTLEQVAAGGTSVTYDADATVGGMIGGVGQRMLVGVSKRMAAEFFDNVDALLRTPGAGLPDEAAAPKPSGASRLPPGPSTVAAASSVRPAPGAVFTAPTSPTAGRDGSAFARGVTAGAAAALVGALVGAWISRKVAR
jgi:carbon monoxide dehydrogenase subunit G